MAPKKILFALSVWIGCRPVLAANDALQTRETPMIIGGNPFTQVEVGGKTYRIQILKPDDKNKEFQFRCLKNTAPAAVPLVTGTVLITERTRAFVDAMVASCAGGQLIVNPTIDKFGISVRSKENPDIERQIYTTPKLDKVGFGTNF